MRLIQQSPAWTLHAYLRILGIAYTAENSVSAKALGVALPVVVDCNHARSELLALTHLEKQYSGSGAAMTAVTMLCAYLQQSLVLPFMQLKKVSKTEETDLFHALPSGLNLATSVMSYFRDYFDGGRSDIMPGASEAELIEHLRRVYDELNDNLLEKIARGDTPTFKPLDLSKFDPFEDEQPTSTVSSPARSPGRRKKSPDATIAEAVLFGHMAEVLCTHEKLATILTQYEGLLSFFQFMCSTFFTVPYAHTVASGDDSLGWKSAMDAILNNRFFQATGSERIRQCLLHGAAIPCTKPASTDRETGDDFNLRGGRSSSLFDGDIYPEHESVADDSNPLAHHPAASPPPKLSVSTTTSTAAALVVAPKDPYAVHDYPTVLGNVRLDLSLSADWRRAYQSLASVFGTTKAVSVKANDDGKSSEAGKDGAPVHTVTLGGVTMLLAVAGSFAGYGYYVSRKKR